jgi:hypothetical protein
MEEGWLAYNENALIQALEVTMRRRGYEMVGAMLRRHTLE